MFSMPFIIQNYSPTITDMPIISILCFMISVIKYQQNYFVKIVFKEVDKLGLGPGDILILYFYYIIQGRENSSQFEMTIQ